MPEYVVFCVRGPSSNTTLKWILSDVTRRQIPHPAYLMKEYLYHLPMTLFYYNLVINFVKKMTINIQKTYFICYILYSYKHPLFSIISVNCFQKNIYEYNYMVLAFGFYVWKTS